MIQNLTNYLPGKPNSPGMIPSVYGGSLEGPIRDGIAWGLKQEGYEIRLEFQLTRLGHHGRAIDILARKDRRLLIVEVKTRDTMNAIGQLLVYAHRLQKWVDDGTIPDCDSPVPVLAAPLDAWDGAVWQVCKRVGIEMWRIGNHQNLTEPANG